ALSMLVLNAIAAFRPGWRYGAVAAVALSLQPEEGEALGVIVPRLLAIGVGAVVGTASSLIVWPENSSRRAERHLRDALHAITECLDCAGLAASGSEADSGDAWSRYHFNVRQAHVAAKSARFHKPAGLLDRIQHVERLYNSVLILDRVAEESTTVGTGSSD